MSILPTDDAITRFKANEERIDIFVNDPLSTGYYTTNEQTPRQVKTLPELADGIVESASLRSDLASSSAGKGASLVTFIGPDSNPYTVADLASDATGKGDALIRTKQPFAGAVTRTQHDKNLDFISVKDFGAVGDGTTNDYNAIAATITAVKARGGGIVYFPTGTYVIESTIVIDTGDYVTGIILQGEGRNTIIKKTTAGDAIHFSTTQIIQNSGMRDIGVWCVVTAGHCVNFVYGCTTCFFDNCEMVQNNPAKAIFYGDWTSFGGGVYDTKFRGGSWYCDPNSTESGVRFLCNGTIFNENIFENMRCYYAKTNQFFRIGTSVTTEAWLTNNRFRNINFELCIGGGIQFDTAKNWTLEGLSFWDTGAAYANHLIDMIAGNGYESVNNTITNVSRNGDNLAAGVYDIRIASGQDTILTNVYTNTANSPKYHFSDKRVLIIGTMPGTITGISATLFLNPLYGMRFPNVTGASLNYYDEGDVTLTLTTSGIPPTTPATATAKWSRVGRMVTVTGLFYHKDLTGATGNLMVTGLPFAANAYAVATIGISGLGSLPVIGSLPASQTTIYIVDSKDISSNIAVTAGNNKDLQLTITYQV